MSIFVSAGVMLLLILACFVVAPIFAVLLGFGAFLMLWVVAFFVYQYITTHVST